MLIASLAFTPSIAAEALVHAGDQVDVRVFGHPELSSIVTVDSHNHISLPLVGDVDVTGRTPTQIAASVEQSLSTYLRKPGVTVRLAGENGNIFVAGGGQGILKYSSGETLSSAIADFQAQLQSGTGQKTSSIADLEHSRVDLTRVGLLRDGKSMGSFDVVQLWSSGAAGPALVPGDTIQLPNKPISVAVSGAVSQPGMTYLTAKQPLSEAVTQTGGLTPAAASAGLTLERGGEKRTVALADPVFTQPAMPGDVVTIPEAPRISVAGMVGSPGQVVLRSNFSLLNALYVAGGPNKWGNIKNVQVVHGGVSSHYDITALQHGDISQNPALSDGDLVFVPEGHRIDFGSLFQGLAVSRGLFPL